MFVRGNDCAHVSTIVSITDMIFVIFVMLYSFCNYIEHQSFKYVFFYLAAICNPIKSHQSNQTRSTTLRTLKSCKYSSYFIPFCTCISIVYVVLEQFTPNILIPQQN
jgi:hypothetical protein